MRVSEIYYLASCTFAPRVCLLLRATQADGRIPERAGCRCFFRWGFRLTLSDPIERPIIHYSPKRSLFYPTAILAPAHTQIGRPWSIIKLTSANLQVASPDFAVIARVIIVRQRVSCGSGRISKSRWAGTGCTGERLSHTNAHA